MPEVKRIDSLVKQLTMPKIEHGKSVNSAIREINTQNAGSAASTVGRVLQSASQVVDQIIISSSGRVQVATRTKPQIDNASAIEEFVRLVINGGLGIVDPGSLKPPRDHEIHHWQKYKAIMIALIYSQADQDTMSGFQNVVMDLTKHDVMPHSTAEARRYALFEVMHLWQKAYDFYAGYHHLALATRKDGIEPYSMFERFIRHLNNRGNYRAFHPKMNGGTIKDFPGPGFVINGIHKKANRHLNHELSVPISNSDNYYQRVQKKYREFIVAGENELKNSRFVFLRGIQGVSNPKMRIDGREYALIIFNDHFHNPTGRMAYLVPKNIFDEFINGARGLGPISRLNDENIFYPASIEQRLQSELVKLCCISTISGMAKALPEGSKLYPRTEFRDKGKRRVVRPLFEFENIYKDKETTDISGKIHLTHMFGGYWNTMRDQAPGNFEAFVKAHREVTDCTQFGFAQLDLVYDAFRTYSLGFSWNEMDAKWDYNPTRLLEQAIRWHYVPDPEEVNVRPPILQEDEKPLLIPVPRLQYSQINPALFDPEPDPSVFNPNTYPVGFLDTRNMIFYRRSPAGDSILPGSCPIEDEDFDPETKKLFTDFVLRAHRSNSDLVFVQGDQIRDIVFDIMASGYHKYT